MTVATILPAWGVLPIAALLMLVVAGHMEATRMATRPESRRRIRLANGWVMLVTIPLIASGFSILDPEVERRAFVMIWVGVVWLLVVSLLLAILDVFNTIRIARHDQRALASSFKELTRDIARLRAERRDSAEGPTADSG